MPLFIRILLSISVAILASSCATQNREVQTPEGAVDGDLFQEMDVLGLSSRVTCTGKRENGINPFNESITINVPPGTQAIMASMRGWGMGYGDLEPVAGDERSDCNGGIRKAVDHHFGDAFANVWVEDIDAMDTSTTPPTQTATISVQLILNDKNPSDDSWYGYLTYDLLFLGETPRFIPDSPTIPRDEVLSP